MNLRKPAISFLCASTLSMVPSCCFAHYETEQEKTEAATYRAAHPDTSSIFDPWKLLEMALTPAYAESSNVSITTQGKYRIIRSNGLPNHATGAFPNAGNPNTISEQHYVFRMPLNPKEESAVEPLGMNPFGVAINGIPFDPGAAEWWHGDRGSGWQYEAMSLGPRLGIDSNNAHVQPSGAYHYHGLPTGLLDKLSSAPKPTLIGYAADGFPIYAPSGYSDPRDVHSPLKRLKSSYRVKEGTRPSGPGGKYDGSFTADYEYEIGHGDLDECNGRFTATTEYPKGIYCYFITDSFPYIPRFFKGTPDASFERMKMRPRNSSSPDGFGPGGFGPTQGRGQQGQQGQEQGQPPPFGKGPSPFRSDSNPFGQGPPPFGLGPPPFRSDQNPFGQGPPPFGGSGDTFGGMPQQGQ